MVLAQAMIPRTGVMDAENPMSMKERYLKRFPQPLPEQSCSCHPQCKPGLLDRYVQSSKIVREVKVASEPEALLAVLKNPAYRDGGIPSAVRRARRTADPEWPREIHIEGDPADVTAIVDAYADWLKTSSLPKLFVKAESGGILAGGKVLEHARSLPAQTEVTVKGVHFVQEDSPDEIGRAVAGWMKTLG